MPKNTKFLYFYATNFGFSWLSIGRKNRQTPSGWLSNEVKLVENWVCGSYRNMDYGKNLLETSIKG